MKESPLDTAIATLNSYIEEPEITTKRLADIITMSVGFMDGLIDGLKDFGPNENDEWAKNDVLRFKEIIIRANYKAHTILNPWLEMPPLEEQIAEGLAESKLMLSSLSR